LSVIAISRGSLSAAVKLADGLSKELGAKVITREQVIVAAERYGLQETGLLEKHIMEQHPPGFWERYSDARKHYLTCFKAALLDFVLQGPVIYHGNLAHILLDDIPFVLRVRVNAPLENRIRVLMDEQGMSREAAAEKVNEMDHSRMRWTQFVYDVDTRSPILFDIVLNLQRMTIQDGVDLVASEARKDQFQRNEKSISVVRDIHLATVAETYLMHFPDTYGLDLEVRADSSTGKVVVTGHIPAGDERAIEADIRSALSETDVIKEVEVKVKTG
jgi:cytidylate kinase